MIETHMRTKVQPVFDKISRPEMNGSPVGVVAKLFGTKIIVSDLMPKKSKD